MKPEKKEARMELRGETEVVLKRYFAAPRELV
nr:ATPase [Leptospiraceae bacterium]